MTESEDTTIKNYKNNQKTKKNAVNTNLPLITINVNELNLPIKKHRVN